MITQADSRKWMACLYNSFLFMEAKIMKMAKKLLAVVLTGVMALSMLTGCALSDAVAEKELLNKMNTFGAADSVKYAVEKKDGDFDLADARDKAVKAVKDLDDSKDPATETITVNGAVVCVVEVPSSGSNKWSKAAKAVNTKMVASANKTGTGTVKTIKVNKDTVTVKATVAGENAAKSRTYVVIVAKAQN
jgi:hypothetical protein